MLYYVSMFLPLTHMYYSKPYRQHTFAWHNSSVFQIYTLKYTVSELFKFLFYSKNKKSISKTLMFVMER